MNRPPVCLRRAAAPVLALCALLAGCSDGVVTDGPAPVVADVGYPHPSATVNDPSQTLLEAQARPWFGTRRQRNATCGPLQQSADDAFATSGFARSSSTQGEAFLIAREPAAIDSPEYIEFCVNVPELGAYRITARVFAPDIDQDSFFVTVDEDAAGAIAEPGIYDVARSSDGFRDDSVSTRSQRPLALTLDAGEHVVRFYYRERNTALAGIRVERTRGAPGASDPGFSEALAQCAANTGLSTTEIDALIERYLGDAPRVFALEGFPISFTAIGERDQRVQRVNWFFDTVNGRANILCLAEPPPRAYNLIANTVGVDRLVIGSAGPDRLRVSTPLLGTLFGNAGDDRVDTLLTGRFIAGAGDDQVGSFAGEGVFDGGEGSDLVRIMEAGRFDGGAGDDTVQTQFAGTFDGGAGVDAVERQSAAAVAVNVERIGTAFDALSPPGELRFLDATTSSALLRWEASPDERIDGYAVTITREGDRTQLNELGVPPSSLTLRLTESTAYAVDRFDPQVTRVSVYAFQQLDDGSALYSDPVEATFEPGLNTDFLVAGDRQAETVIERRFRTSTLSDGGRVIVSANSTADDTPGPVFQTFDGSLEPLDALNDQALTDSGYRVYLGTRRQYVVPDTRGGRRASVIAYDGSASQSLWQRDVSVPIDQPFQEFQRCFDAVVTQDDALVCVRPQGGLEAFDLDGNARRVDAVELPILTNTLLLDGDGGQLVSIDREQHRPFDAFTRIDTAAGTIENVPVDLSALSETDDEVIDVAGLAVVGDRVILTGAVVRTRLPTRGSPPCPGRCDVLEGERSAYFIARIALSDGRLQAFRRITLDQRPGDGIGLLAADRRSVVFGRQNLLTRYDVDTLETRERRPIPGTVEAISEAAVLVQQRLFLADQPFLETGSRLYLLNP